MIKGIGIDIVELSRIEKILEKGDRFPQKVLTPKEFEVYQTLNSMKKKVEYVGAHFSIKESFSKAWGTGLGAAVGLQDVETLTDKLGKPITTATMYQGNIFTSVSHDGGLVITQVILEDEK